MRSFKSSGVILSLAALIYPSKCVQIEEVVTLDTEIEDLIELGEIMDTVSSQTMYARVNNMGLLFSQIRDTVDTINGMLPKSPETQVPSTSALAALKKVEEKVQDTITHGRRVAEGRHKGLGTAFSAYEWARLTKKSFEKLLNNKNPESFFAAVAPFKLQALNLDAKVKLAKIQREQNGGCMPCKVQGLPPRMRGAVQAAMAAQRQHEMCCEINENRLMDLFEILQMKVDEWESIVGKVAMSVEHVITAINAMFPEKPKMGSGGDMKREPRNEEVAAAVSVLHDFPFMLGNLRAKDFSVNLDNFVAMKDFALRRLTNPVSAVAEAGPVNELAARIEGLAELEQIVRLTHSLPQTILQQVESVVAKGSAKSSDRFKKMRHVEIDELVNEMDKYLYNFDLRMPGNALHQADVVWTALAKESSFWEGAFLRDLSLSSEELQAVRELVTEFHGNVKNFIAVSVESLVPKVKDARKRLLELMYRF